MDGITSGAPMEAQIYAMKKATEVQAAGLMKVLESAQAPQSQNMQSAASAITGLGQNLDIRG